MGAAMRDSRHRADRDQPVHGGRVVVKPTLDEQLDREMSEAALKRLVIDAAHEAGWLVHHHTNSWKSRNSQSGDLGYPDLTMARRGRVIFAELKRETEQPEEAQVRWADAIMDGGFIVPYIQFRVWRPSDWRHGYIREELA
jgi:hypothetical protein